MSIILDVLENLGADQEIVAEHNCVISKKGS